MSDNTFIGPVAGGYMTPSYAWIVNPDTLEFATVQIDASASSDAGNSAYRTSYLRPGLCLGKITATGLYKHYSDAAGDGSETVKAILAQGVDLLDPLGVVKTEDPAGVSVVVKGHIDATLLIGIDAAGKTDLRNAGFILAEDF